MALKMFMPEETAMQQRTREFSIVLAPDNADTFAAQLQDIALLNHSDAYDVLIVDRGLSALVTQLISGLQGDIAVVRSESSASFASVCNSVASQVAGQRLVFVAPDAQLYPGWLQYMEEAFAADPSLSVVRAGDCEAVALSPITFAAVRGFNHDSKSGNEISDLCFAAAASGARVGFDRNRITGPSALRRHYMQQGYVKLEGFLDPDLCDRILNEADEYYRSCGTDPYSLNRVMNFHMFSPTATEHLTGERFTSKLRECFGEDPLFLQTILFYEGSQQQLHSDWIYMSTDRHHRLMGTWLALEDVQDDAGPLRYLPGSQRLPIESIQGRWERMRPEIEAKIARGEMPPPGWMSAHPSGKYGHLYYGWEDSIGPAAKAAGYEEVRFLAKKGDVLLWHANVIHGGTPIERPGSTRRSVVAHYLTREIGAYYDINYADNGRGLSPEEASYNALNVTPELRLKDK